MTEHCTMIQYIFGHIYHNSTSLNRHHMKRQDGRTSSYFISSLLEPYKLVNYTVWVIMAFVGAFFLWFLFGPNSSRNPFAMAFLGDKLNYRIVIPFLTCDKTCWRNSLYIKDMIDESALSNSTFYSYVISDSEVAIQTAKHGILTPHCTGGRLSANGNACRFDVTFKHFYYETSASWLLVAIDDTYLNKKNLFHLLDLLESLYDPLVDQVATGQPHHDWGTHYPHGGSGLLYSRAWVDEFFRTNQSFERIHENNFRYTYDIATGLLNLNYFEKAIWIEHPWLCVILPEAESFEFLIKKNWKDLPGCPRIAGVNNVLVNLRDVAQFHISPFKKETAGFVQDLEFAPEEVKIYRPSSYGIRFCWEENSKRTVPFTAEGLKRFVINKKKMNAKDAKKRKDKFNTTLPW